MIKNNKRIGITIQILFSLALICYTCVLPAEAALVIEPALINLELSQNRSSGAFVIKNTGDNEERYRAKSVHFILTPEGALKEIAPDERSLAGWVKFNPKEFVLPPKSSRVVRFSVIPEGKVRPKEYWGAIEFMPLEGAKVTSQDKFGRPFNITVLSVVLVPIYGYVKGTKYSCVVKDIGFKKEIEKGKTYVYCNFLNTGDGVLRLSGSCQIADASGAVVDKIELKSFVVFTATERILKAVVKKTLPPGRYRAKINMKSIDPRYKAELSAETEFNL